MRAGVARGGSAMGTRRRARDRRQTPAAIRRKGRDGAITRGRGSAPRSGALGKLDRETQAPAPQLTRARGTMPAMQSASGSERSTMRSVVLVFVFALALAPGCGSGASGGPGSGNATGMGGGSGSLGGSATSSGGSGQGGRATGGTGGLDDAGTDGGATDGGVDGAPNDAKIAGDANDGGLADLKMMTFNIRYANPADGVNAWPNRRNLVYQVIRDQ